VGVIRVMVAASSAISRAGLEALVRSDPRFVLVGDSHRAGDLVLQASEYHPDILLLEAGDSSHLARAYALSQQAGAPGLILLAGDLSRLEVRRALQSGARAVLPRAASPVEIVAAIEAVGAGLAVVTAEDLEALAPVLPEMSAAAGFDPGEPLTTRESEVLAMLAEGAGNKEIATRLHISEHTVKFHVSSILAKLGAATRTEAVARGFKEGLIML
jgi:NarL family two-component system response regulator YdfI